MNSPGGDVPHGRVFLKDPKQVMKYKTSAIKLLKKPSHLEISWRKLNRKVTSTAESNTDVCVPLRYDWQLCVQSFPTKKGRTQWVLIINSQESHTIIRPPQPKNHPTTRSLHIKPNWGMKRIENSIPSHSAAWFIGILTKGGPKKTV